MKRNAKRIDFLKGLRAVLLEKTCKETEVTVEIIGRRGFRYAGIAVFWGGIVLSIYLYKSRFRYGFSRSLLTDLFLSFFHESDFKAELKVGPEKIVDVLRNFSSAFAVLLAFQFAGFSIVLSTAKQQLPSRTLGFGLCSLLVFIVGFFWTLIDIQTALYGGVPIEPWHFSALMILLSTGTAFTLFLLQAILDSSGTSRSSHEDRVQKENPIEKNCE